MKNGYLPTLHNLINKGIHGDLVSTIPPVTPVAWSTLITGKNPGKHGIYGWLWKKPDTWEFLPFSGSQRVGSAWWKYLNEQGIRVGLVNIPLSYPPSPMLGFTICDFGAPSNALDLTYPTELKYQLEQSFDWKGGINLETAFSLEQYEQLFEAVSKHQNIQIQIAIKLAHQFEVDVLAINLMLFDTCNHNIHDRNLINKSLALCDLHLSQLLEGFQPDNTILISDHGARRTSGTFLLGHWLHDSGYLYWKPRQIKSKNHTNWLLNLLFSQKYGISGFPLRAIRSISREFLWYSPENLQTFIWRFLRSRNQIINDNFLFENTIDPLSSYVYPAPWGTIYLNDDLWTKKGTMNPFQIEDSIEILLDKLLKIKDPENGERIFKAVHRREEIYDGPLVDFAPHLVLDYCSSRWDLIKDLSPYIIPHHKYFVPSEIKGWYGSHSPTGFFTCVGAQFRHSSHHFSARLEDIPATLLYLYDQLIPEDWDGAPQLDWIKPDFSNNHPVHSRPGDDPTETPSDYDYSSDDVTIITERLRALGYLD